MALPVVMMMMMRHDENLSYYRCGSCGRGRRMERNDYFDLEEVVVVHRENDDCCSQHDADVVLDVAVVVDAVDGVVGVVGVAVDDDVVVDDVVDVGGDDAEEYQWYWDYFAHPA